MGDLEIPEGLFGSQSGPGLMQLFWKKVGTGDLHTITLLQ